MSKDFKNFVKWRDLKLINQKLLDIIQKKEHEIKQLKDKLSIINMQNHSQSKSILRLKDKIDFILDSNSSFIKTQGSLKCASIKKMLIFLKSYL